MKSIQIIELQVYMRVEENRMDEEKRDIIHLIGRRRNNILFYLIGEFDWIIPKPLLEITKEDLLIFLLFFHSFSFLLHICF